jgi:hypothetical protein
MPVSLPLGEIQPFYSSCILNNFLISYFSKAPRNSLSRYRLNTKILAHVFNLLQNSREI